MRPVRGVAVQNQADTGRAAGIFRRCDTCALELRPPPCWSCAGRSLAHGRNRSRRGRSNQDRGVLCDLCDLCDLCGLRGCFPVSRFGLPSGARYFRRDRRRFWQLAPRQPLGTVRGGQALRRPTRGAVELARAGEPRTVDVGQIADVFHHFRSRRSFVQKTPRSQRPLRLLLL